MSVSLLLLNFAFLLCNMYVPVNNLTFTSAFFYFYAIIWHRFPHIMSFPHLFLASSIHCFSQYSCILSLISFFQFAFVGISYKVQVFILSEDICNTISIILSICFHHGMLSLYNLKFDGRFVLEYIS